VKARPILFSAPMVRALLDGRKTQTRRILKPQPPVECGIHYMLGNESWLDDENQSPLRHYWEAWGGPLFENKPADHLCGSHSVRSPHGKPGDQLWVREAWSTHACFDHIPPRDLTTRSIHYQADGTIKTGKYRQAFHMPRWASRITLEIISVRVERLQDISESDALAEGIESITGDKTIYHWDFPKPYPDHAVSGYQSARSAYQELWCEISGRDSYDANPWVWVIEFRRVEQ